MAKMLTVILISFASVCAAAGEPNAANGPDPFKMNHLLGRGVNFGNAFDAPSEGEWGVVLQEEYFQAAKDAGFRFNPSACPLVGSRDGPAALYDQPGFYETN